MRVAIHKFYRKIHDGVYLCRVAAIKPNQEPSVQIELATTQPSVESIGKVTKMKILYNDGNPFGLKLLLCAKFGQKDVTLAKVALNGECVRVARN